MSLPIQLSPGAQEDLQDASDWYSLQSDELRIAFIEAVNSTLLTIQREPRGFQVVFGSSIRRAIVTKFPFAIIYIPEETRIYVYSVFHTSQNPLTWQIRIN